MVRGPCLCSQTSAAVNVILSVSDLEMLLNLRHSIFCEVKVTLLISIVLCIKGNIV